ncbi:MAG: LD-carboxypeptidase [Desulfobulbaceae bacterium]|nr:LD-carboxypeptidase [Desulfobulbaceae bacterium]
MILPPPLKNGDCIGLFSPSGPVRDPAQFEAGLQLLHNLGYRTRYTLPGQCPSHEYLAAEDRARAEEFHAMWTDPEIQAMMAVRGGYGCLRMMPYLDMDLLRQNPKLVIGFSDLTVLLNTLVDRANIAAVHGPVLTSLAGSDKKSVDSFISVLEGRIAGTRSFGDPEVLRGGRAEGILRGGNLATIAHLLGTPWEVPFKGALLLLEDTGEPMYRIDRMLTQLYVSGRLDSLSGLLLGTFDCSTEEEINMRLKDQVWKRVLELTADTDYPIWGNIPVGHLAANHAVLLGLKTTMDSNSGTMFTSSIKTNKR